MSILIVKGSVAEQVGVRMSGHLIALVARYCVPDAGSNPVIANTMIALTSPDGNRAKPYPRGMVGESQSEAARKADTLMSDKLDKAR